ncbi:MAG: hypothetical protein ACRD2T_10020, partial [Thermoanaerobaculia bacterium]
LGAMLPGLSFLFLAPALLAGLAGALAPGSIVAALLPLAAAGAVWFPILRFLPDALKTGILPVVAALLGLAVTGLAPLAAGASRQVRWGAVSGLGLAALALAGWGLALPPFTPNSPQAVNVGFHQTFNMAGHATAARLFSAPEPLRLPREVARAAPWRDEPQPLYPWIGVRVLEAPVPTLALPPPELIVIEDEIAPAAAARRRVVSLKMVSRRAAPILGLAVPPGADVRGVKVAGTPVPEGGGRTFAPGRLPGWREVIYTGAPPEGVEVELALGHGGPLELHVFDRSYGLPPAGARVARRRPPTAVPIGLGDTTVFTRVVRVPPTP